MKGSPEQERQLFLELQDPTLKEDLYRWVLFAYPWGKRGGPLEHRKGPNGWQREDLDAMTAHIKKNKELLEKGFTPEVYREATSSGRGTGKTAKMAWRANWMMTSQIGSTTIITANTEAQLKTRTFAEIKRWTTLLINSHWFEAQSLAIHLAPEWKRMVEDQLKIDCAQYYIMGQLWSEETPDAFAGAHNAYGLLLDMDEASGIPNEIFRVSEGFFTDPTLHRYWCAQSNPRRNSGAFHDIFKVHNKYWRTRMLDSRSVEGLDHTNFDRMIEQYGIDSDTVRVEVLGQFPMTGTNQFISNELVYAAQSRELVPDDGSALIMGYDPARWGPDENVIRWRKGRDARSIPPQRWQGADNVKSADIVADWIDRTDPDGVFIDSGAGGGIIDILKSRGYRVTEVTFGGKAIDRQWANKRTEMYAELRKWLPGGCLRKDDQRMFTELTALEYDYYGKAKDQQILLPKDMLKEVIGWSPGDSDALALTFAGPVARRDLRAGRFTRGRGEQRELRFGEG